MVFKELKKPPDENNQGEDCRGIKKRKQSIPMDGKALLFSV